MSTRAVLLPAALLFRLCQPSSADGRCDLAGDWTADLGAYDGKAELSHADDGRYEVTLICKAKHEATMRRRPDSGELELQFPGDPSQKYECVVVDDCAVVRCTTPGFQTLEFTRTAP